MQNLVMRQNKRFIINKNYVKKVSGSSIDEVCTALYAEMYLEFRGANTNREYSKLTNIERLEAINNFAKDWLKQRGFYNEEAEK
jgi:hypothetical protein